MGKAVVIALFVSACAAAGVSGGDKQDAAVNPHEDAHFVVQDAPKLVDAHVADAFVQRDAPPDSSGGTVGDGGLCTDSSQCAVAGECCVTLGGPAGFCAPGTVVLGACIPQ
jgi:hypothetical protein